MTRIVSHFKMFGIAVVVAMLMPSAVHAQDWIGPTPMDYANMNMNFANTLINNAMIERMVRERGSYSGKKRDTHRPQGHTTKAKTNSPSNVSSAAFAYTATAAQRAAYRDAYIARLAKSQPQLAASLRAQFKKYDYNTIYNGLLSGTGLKSNNLADAFTAYTVLGWLIVNGRTSDPSPSSISGVRRQWADALSGTDFATNADIRRKTAEEMKIKMVLLQAGWNDARKIKQSPMYANAVDKLFQSHFKLKLKNMTLNAAGLKMHA